MRLIDADALLNRDVYYDRTKCLVLRYEIVKAPTIEAAPRWIPVTERLPENEQDVLITVRRKHYCKPGEYIRFVVKAFYTDGKHDTEHSAYTWFDGMEYDEESDAYKIPEGWWESIEYGEEFQAVGDSVTHWMPLPACPEELR